MKTFANTCAQGDIFIRKIDALPKGAIRVEPEKGQNVIAHSETGHDHLMDAATTTLYRLPDSIMECLLVVDQPTPLRHLREFDTHQPIMFEPGTYHVRRQREYTPEGFRRVED